MDGEHEHTGQGHPVDDGWRLLDLDAPDGVREMTADERADVLDKIRAGQAAPERSSDDGPQSGTSQSPSSQFVGSEFGVAEFELPESMRQSALREIENPTPAGPPDDPAQITARIQEIRDRIHAQALDEYLHAMRRMADELGPDELDADDRDDDRDDDTAGQGWTR